jgi:hypothetical protein
MYTLTNRYCRIAWLPSNRGRMVTWIRSPLLYCCVHVGCIATNNVKASVSIGTARCCKGKAIHNSQLVSLWKRKKSVSLWDRSESSSVSGSRRDQPSKRAFTVRSQQLARVAVTSGARQFSVYLVASYCVSSQ